MDKIMHHINEEGNLVITVSGDGYCFGAVLVPRIVDGYPHIKRDAINTEGLDYSEEIKNMIVKAITTQRGKNKENPVVVDE